MCPSREKQYGYLSKPLKKLVDTIVDELEQEAEVARCYETWNALRDQLGGYYSQAEREHSPLSQQKEFRRIKNIVIAEAMNMQLGIPTFEDDEMDDEPEPKFNCTREEKVAFENAQVFRRAKEILYNPDINVDDKTASIRALEKLYDSGYPVAAHLLGKLYRDGVFVQQNLDVAEHWFRCSAIAGNDYSQYALGKLLLKARPQEALQWLSAAAEQNNQFAHYTLGKMYLVGEAVSKDTLLALSHLLSSADQGNQYAQYTLGKIYLQGTGVERNREAARKWFEKSAAQGNQYAQFFLEHFKVIKSPSTFLCTTRLLHHMSKIFRDNSQPPANPAGMRIDSKRRKKLQEKRIALGHKPDDHEEYSFNMHMHM